MAVQKVGIGWEISLQHGWGIHGYHLAKRIIERRDVAIPIAVAGQLCDLAVTHEGKLLHVATGPAPAMETIPDFPVIYANGNRPASAGKPAARKGDMLIQVFDDTLLAVQDIRYLAGFGHRLITASQWNASVLKGHGIEATCCPIGVDTELFKPRARPFDPPFGEDRFVIFSGGKLELRKGQDVVLAAFKVFQERHPDTLLVTMWHNYWPETMKSMLHSPHLGNPAYDPDFKGGGAVAWAYNNHVDINAVKELGIVPHIDLAYMMASFDVALFPNRCEGGTNMVAMECLASGVPTILTAGHGHDDLITFPVPCYALDQSKPCTLPGANGYWVEPDLEEVIEALEHVYENRGEARRTGLNAAETMQLHWDWSIRMDAQITALRIGKDDSGLDRAMAATKATLEQAAMDETAKEYAKLAGGLRDQGHRKAAVAIAKRAVAMAPKNAEVMNQYGNMLLTDHQPDRAFETCAKALALSPAMANYASSNMGLAKLYAGQPDAALREFDKTKDSLIDVAYDRAHTLLSMGRWKEGLEAIEVRRLHKPDNYPKRSMKEWEGEEVDTLWVTAEQGIGDSFMFARFLPWARSKCKRLVFSANAATMSMFAGYPMIDELRLLDPMMPDPDANAHAPLLSLLNFARVRIHDIPPDPGHFKMVASKITADLRAAFGMLKVGLVWAGNPGHLRDWERSIPLEMFLPLIEKPSIQLYSLQLGSHARDIEATGLSQVMADLSSKLVSWPITASVVSRLDALVTCDTAVAHLAGALGVPTYLLICKLADWRWLTKRDDTPWYPSVTLCRQKILGDWRGPILDCTDKLCRMKGKQS